MNEEDIFNSFLIIKRSLHQMLFVLDHTYTIEILYIGI